MLTRHPVTFTAPALPESSSTFLGVTNAVPVFPCVGCLIVYLGRSGVLASNAQKIENEERRRGRLS